MSQDWDFNLYLTVHDPAQLVQAARAHPGAAGMATEEFYDEDGNVDVKVCLVMLLDPGKLPGCEIIDSGAEHIEPFEADLGDRDD